MHVHRSAPLAARNAQEGRNIEHCRIVEAVGLIGHGQHAPARRGAEGRAGGGKNNCATRHCHPGAPEAPVK